MLRVLLFLLAPLLSGQGGEDTLTTHDMLVRMVCAECKGCPRSERRGVLFVALNRVEQPGWWGHDLESVLAFPGQFAGLDSPRCRDELPPAPSRVDGHVGWSPHFVAKHERLMTEMREDAWGALQGTIEDPVQGATYFHARRLGLLWPHLQEVPVPDTWNHRFFQSQN